MHHILLLIVMSNLAADLSTAQSNVATPGEPAEAVRYEYKRVDTIPDYLAFFSEANRIRHRSLTNPGRALENTKAIFGLAVESTAVQMVDQVTAFLSDLQADYEELEVALRAFAVTYH